MLVVGEQAERIACSGAQEFDRVRLPRSRLADVQCIVGNDDFFNPIRIMDAPWSATAQYGVRPFMPVQRNDAGAVEAVADRGEVA